jgi:thiamine transporter ThiT
MDIVNLRSVRAVIGFLLTWALIANSTIFEKKLVKQSLKLNTSNNNYNMFIICSLNSSKFFLFFICRKIIFGSSNINEKIFLIVQSLSGGFFCSINFTGLIIIMCLHLTKNEENVS